ncbi:sortase [Nocardioides sp. 503]|uniref:sortase domain-containing protein n=1 Tax=Nocardioides sp. 503 TaxID=2508326 RepID=UPI001FD6893B|nr:sortase [Nocardioides sp. 503]
MRQRTLARASGLLIAASLLAACADASSSEDRRPRGPGPGPTGQSRTPSSTPTPTGTPTPTSTPSSSPITVPPAYQVSDGRPRDAALTIAELGLRDLRVVSYRGFTDDAPGTEIQNGGRAASPSGPRGGVGPGGIGNYQVTAHRTSSTRAFERLPELRRGDRVVVSAGGVEYVYRIVATRETSFRSPRSLREQRAAVPGRPGVAPTRAMITLSTCATAEDHAEGNYWADEFDNPEHRIDKIGVLVDTRPAA